MCDWRIVPAAAILQVLAGRIGKADDHRLFSDGTVQGERSHVAAQIGEGAAAVRQNEEWVGLARIVRIAAWKTDIDLVVLAGNRIRQRHRYRCEIRTFGFCDGRNRNGRKEPRENGRQDCENEAADRIGVVAQATSDPMVRRPAFECIWLSWLKGGPPHKLEAPPLGRTSLDNDFRSEFYAIVGVDDALVQKADAGGAGTTDLCQL